MNGLELTTNWLIGSCWPWTSSEGLWSMVCRAQSRLEDKKFSLVGLHNIQYLGILGGTRTLAGCEKPG